MNKKISVIGGDLRQLTLAKLLSEDGYDVSVFGFGKDSISEKYDIENDLTQAAKSDILILPMPASIGKNLLNAPFAGEEIKLSDISENALPNALVLGGKLSESIYDLFKFQKCVDYSEREELMIKNAVPTAEGAIELAISETPTTIAGSRCLVIGYGRIGKVLSKLLHDMNAYVTVSARKHSDLAWISVNGCNAAHNKDIINSIGEYDIIFNTAPALILDEKVLERINPDSTVIDLASKPGGVDFGKAKDLGLKVIWALSIPGKTAPISSGKIIKEAVSNIFDEEGV